MTGQELLSVLGTTTEQAIATILKSRTGSVYRKRGSDFVWRTVHELRDNGAMITDEWAFRAADFVQASFERHVRRVAWGR